MAEALPFGLRDVKLTPLDEEGTEGTAVDLPNSRTFSFEETESYEELRGDDRVVATRGTGAAVSWELESGGISLEALVVLNGGAVVITGTGATEVKTYSKKVTDARPEFKVEGQAMSESGGDFHVVIHRCKANSSVSGELSDGSFWLTSASGVGMAKRDGSDELYDLVQNVTATAIA
jgi:hypothetical protein